MNDIIGEIKMKYNYALVVGRFQPYHNSHHELVKYALSLGETVLIVLGSAKSAPDIKNPFTPEQREKMIRACFPEDTQSRLKFFGVRDYPYHENVWISEIQNIVRNEIEEQIDLPIESDAMHNIELSKFKTCLVGHFKDETSYYLKLFPQWTFESFYHSTNEAKVIHATDIRALYLNYGNKPNSSKAIWDKITKYVPKGVIDFLTDFFGTEDYENLVKSYNYIEEYKKNSKFVGMPFNPTFVTTDAVVTCKGHILVVRRGANPGKGLLALPGGFLADGLTLKQNVIKELKEETRIHIPSPILESSITNQEVFDYPHRSLRGRTITHAYYFHITTKMEEGLPLVKGGDDAEKAFWLPIASLGDNEDKFFEDHLSIIKTFLRLA
jgi:bifunctional NMN adenylyltransferase/nudix hydrolase